MSTPDYPVLIFAAVTDKEVASDITATLLTLGLAASVSYWDGMTSVNRLLSMPQHSRVAMQALKRIGLDHAG